MYKNEIIKKGLIPIEIIKNYINFGLSVCNIFSCYDLKQIKEGPYWNELNKKGVLKDIISSLIYGLNDEQKELMKRLQELDVKQREYSSLHDLIEELKEAEENNNHKEKLIELES